MVIYNRTYIFIKRFIMGVFKFSVRDISVFRSENEIIKIMTYEIN